MKRDKRPPLWLLLFLDLLLAGGFLCVFALFHHVIPYWGRAEAAAPVAVVEKPASVSVPVPAAEVETTPEKTAGTPWQLRFAEQFSDEVEITDHSYKSPTLSIDISTHHAVINGYDQVWYVADIYVAQVENFRTWAGEGSFTRLVQTPMEQLAEDSGGVLCINGDYCNVQAYGGFYVRNGEVYDLNQTACDICVLYYDGTMATYGPLDYTVQEVLDRKPYQVWKFGPRLLDEEGEPLQRFNTSEVIYSSNPRSGIGYYEPGHYCFVTVDGRQADWSLGLSIPQYAQIFKELGCRAAYNLDGGASAAMAFLGSLYSRQSSERDIGDILLIGELAEVDP